MKREDFWVESKYDGLSLAGTLFIPEGEIKGIIQFAHGMCENRGRYTGVLEFFAGQGYAGVIHDHRGHGESVAGQEELGYFKDTRGEAITEDLHQVVCYARRRFPGKPLTLLGHSMGSLVVRKFIQRHDREIDRLIVCGSPSKNIMAGAGIHLARIMQCFKGEKYRSRFIERLATGQGERRFPEENQTNAWLTRDKEAVRAYNEDPANGFIFTLNGYLNLFHLVQDVYNKKRYQVENPSMPILFLAGEEDPVIGSPRKWEQARDFLIDTGYSRMTSKLYAHMRHEILNEIDKEEVYQDIADWMGGKEIFEHKIPPIKRG